MLKKLVGNLLTEGQSLVTKLVVALNYNNLTQYLFIGNEF